MESELNHMESEFRGFQEDCKSGWFQDMQTFHKNVKMFLEQVKTLAIQPLAPFPCEEHVRSHVHDKCSCDNKNLPGKKEQSVQMSSVKIRVGETRQEKEDVKENATVKAYISNEDGKENATVMAYISNEDVKENATVMAYISNENVRPPDMLYYVSLSGDVHDKICLLYTSDAADE